MPDEATITIPRAEYRLLRQLLTEAEKLAALEEHDDLMEMGDDWNDGAVTITTGMTPSGDEQFREVRMLTQTLRARHPEVT